MSEKIYNMVDLETIEKLADIVAAKELGEITIADGEKYITVKGKKCPPPMPLMNEVTSDVDGVVQEILVKNGDAVEYDQPLMILS